MSSPLSFKSAGLNCELRLLNWPIILLHLHSYRWTKHGTKLLGVPCQNKLPPSWSFCAEHSCQGDKALWLQGFTCLVNEHMSEVMFWYFSWNQPTKLEMSKTNLINFMPTSCPLASVYLHFDHTLGKKWYYLKINPFTRDSDKVLLSCFPMNGHTLGFCPYNQKLENFVSPKVHSGSRRVNKQHHSKVLLSCFPMNGHTLRFCPWNQNLANLTLGVKRLKEKKLYYSLKQ